MSDPTVPPPTPPEPPPGPASAAAAAEPAAAVLPAPESTGLQPNIAAALASFLMLIGGIIFLLLEKKNQYVRFYAMQAVFLGGLWIVFAVAMAMAGAILHGVPLVGFFLVLINIVVRLALFAVWLMTTFKAYSGKEWEIPYLGKLARQQLAGGTPTPL